MGFLKIFTRSKASTQLMPLPSGSFTLDREGKIMTSTMPQSFPVSQLQEIGEQVIASFRSAQKAQMRLSEIIISFAALKLLARELRGGAIIFIMPQAPNQPKRS